MDQNFKPAWWMTNRHAQTILPRFFRPNLTLDYNIEEITTPDHDFLQLIWSSQHIAADDKPLAIVLHGLEGNIDSFYAKGMMKALTLAGFDVVLLHFRNCGQKANLQARAYHSGETSDLHFLVNILKQRFPSKPLMAVGFSLGGNVLTKYLGEYEDECQLDAAAVVSAPFALASSCKVIQKSCFKLYQKYLLDRLKKSTARKLDNIKESINLTAKQLENIYDLWEFDNKVTAPLHGFIDAADYYLKSSGKQYLKRITTPTLVIHAKDDPMLSQEAIPQKEDVSNAVKLMVSKQGGHVGFISGKNPFKPIFWLEQQVPHFFQQQLLGKLK
ncbi:hydrolase [Pseudoalteromonas spongiae]|uniref:Hydrolase n=1 Tax=Pseudoalteromonas spongiae TaxID=298657 RepID=A0ABU8EMV9_9GAMM